MDMLFWNRCVGIGTAFAMLCSLSACNDSNINDINIKQQIEAYMEEFKSMYMSKVCGMDQKIFIKSQDIYVDNLGYPIELTVYKNDKGEDVRYQVQLYGETGNSVTDYYLCNGFIYVNQEKEYYSSQILVENYNDVLYRETNDWIIFEDKVYILQDDGEMQTVDEYPFYSIEEVNEWNDSERIRNRE